jgi:hypothetical protein
MHDEDFCTVVVETQRLDGGDLEAGLLAQLAYSSLGRALAGIDSSAWQRPHVTVGQFDAHHDDVVGVEHGNACACTGNVHQDDHAASDRVALSDSARCSTELDVPSSVVPDLSGTTLAPGVTTDD